MTALLIIVSLLLSLGGFLLLSQATAGVGLIAGGILLAVYARIAQAHLHHVSEPHVIAQTAHLREAAEHYQAPPSAPWTKYAVIAFAALVAASVIGALLTIR